MKTLTLTLSKVILALTFIFSFSSCKDRNIINPFDPACPKEIFTPTNFKAEQSGTAVKLSWKQANTNISGFLIKRSENDGPLAEVAWLAKSDTTWNDMNTAGGKKFGYQMNAYAGDNLSNTITIFFTPVFGATVTTAAVSNLTSSSVVLGGNVANEGGAAVTDRGVCYGTAINPTTASSKVEMGSGSGEFSITVTGLTAGTTYYARAYATNSQGTTYGTQVTFTTIFLTVTPNSYYIPREGSSRVFTVTSSTAWQVTSNQSWCTLNAGNGQGNGLITATYTENTVIGQRIATLTFTGTGVASQIATLTQAGTEPPLLIVTPDNQNVTNLAGTTTFNITSNISWTAQSDHAWCSVLNDSGTGNAILNINYEANTTNSQRVAIITITVNGLTPKTVTVTQQSAIPIAGLVAYYPFNGNANDESGNGKNGTTGNVILTSDRKDKANTAYSFNGVSSFIQATNAISGNNFSVNVWISTTNSSSNSSVNFKLQFCHIPAVL